MTRAVRPRGNGLSASAYVRGQSNHLSGNKNSPYSDPKDFLIIGGRLDYVNRRAVAALAYQHRKHVINLYVWPTGGRDEAPAREKSRQGYNVMHWTEQGMTYWAVSDLNQDELGQFRATLLRPPG